MTTLDFLAPRLVPIRSHEDVLTFKGNLGNSQGHRWQYQTDYRASNLQW